MVGGGIINFFRAAKADIRHTGPGLAQAACQSVTQKRPGKAGVTPQHNTLCAQNVHHSPSKGMRQRGVENIRHAATDIVGFEAGEKSAHAVPRLGASVTTIIEQVS